MNYLKIYIEEHKDFPIDGINYLDLNPIYKDGDLLRTITENCIDSIKGSILAHQLGKGVILLRSKKNRLPGKTHTVAHTLEYGESIIEVQEGEGKVLIFDDVLATGGTARGSVEVLKKAGYTPTSALFLVELDFLNPSLSVPHQSVIHYE